MHECLNVTVLRDFILRISGNHPNCGIVMNGLLSAALSISFGISAGTARVGDYDGLKTHRRVEEENEGSP
jgi:hypothetical protein